VAAALAQAAPGPLVVVCPHPGDIDALADDLRLFLAGDEADGEWSARSASGSISRSELPTLAKFPVRDAFTREETARDEIYGDRLRVLKALARAAEKHAEKPGFLERPGFGASPIIITSIQSLLQPVPPREAIARQTRELRTGQSVDLDELAGWLVAEGFHNTTGVQLPGEFSRRGGILDVLAADWLDPVRIEFFGDEIESIRRFDIGSQRSLATLDEVDITALQGANHGAAQRGGESFFATDTSGELPSDPASRKMTPDPVHERAAGEHFAAYLPTGAWFLLIEPSELEDEGQKYWNRVDRPHEYFTVQEVFEKAYRFPTATAESIATGSLETTCHLPFESVERFSGDVTRVRLELESAAAGQDVFIVCQTEAEAKRLQEVFETGAGVGVWGRRPRKWTRGTRDTGRR
jgi:transcription-repair coupling factor (superfamily II helicase)